MPPWYAWIAGALIVRFVWSEVSPVLAVALGAVALLGFWGYRIGAAASVGDQGRIASGRLEARQIVSEIGDVMLGWGLIVIGLLTLGGAIVLWAYSPVLDIAIVVVILGLVALAVRHRAGLREVWREGQWEELESRLRPTLEAWGRGALSTAPADHALAEEVIVEIYSRHGRSAPSVEWAVSPHHFEARLASMRGKPLHDFPPGYMSMIEHGTGWSVWMDLWWELDESTDVENELSAALAAGDGTRRLPSLVQNATWFAFHRDAALVLERPLELHLDAEGRLHNPGGPAVRFADGWARWALDGVLVPAGVIEDRDGFDARTALEIDNLEVRRVVLEHLGWERIISASGLAPIAEDEHGRLWTIPVEGSEALVLLEVRDATIGPDGEQRQYVLRVPPTVRTPREAAAWTFGLREHEYAPELSS